MEKFKVIDGKSYWYCLADYKAGQARLASCQKPIRVRVTLKSSGAQLFDANNNRIWIHTSTTWYDTLSVKDNQSEYGNYYMNFLRETEEDSRKLYQEQLELAMKKVDDFAFKTKLAIKKRFI